MAIEKLSPADIRDAKPGRHGDGGGLWLEVDASGAKRWVFRFMLRSNAREMGMGNLDTITAAKARENARAARELLRDGVDPIDHKREQKALQARAAAAALTFAECSDRFYAAHKATWSAIHALQWDRSVKQYVLPRIGKLPVKLVDTDAVLRVIEPLWTDKTPTASRIRGRIESVLSWAIAGKYRDGPNPASWEIIQHLLPSLSEAQTIQHLDSIPYSAVPAFMATLRQQEGVVAHALEFTILCATRTDETLAATRNEIDLRSRMWIIPGSHTKSGNEHRVPLSDRALEIVQALPIDESGFLFTGGGTTGRLGKNTMYKLLRRLGEQTATVHGFRSSFRTWGAERTAYAHELLEIALAHTQPDAVVRAYQRGDMMKKRRECMEAWAEFINTPYADAENVHPIRKSA